MLCLAAGGRLVTCGATTGYQGKTNLRHVFFRNLQLRGVKTGSKSLIFRILRLVEEGKLKPVLDRTFPIKEARQAHELMEARLQFGKIVLVHE